MDLPKSIARGWPDADLYLLSWVGGAVDALSYVRAGVFTANMTGNTVLLGLAIAGPARSRAFFSALSLAAFAFGVLIGGIILLRLTRSTETARDLSLGTALELPFAVVFSLLWMLYPVKGPFWTMPAMIALAACALGIQSVTVRRLHLSGVATTFITGTITAAILSSLERKEPGLHKMERKSSPFLLAGMWATYILAAIAGGVVAKVNSFAGCWILLVPLLIVFVRVYTASRLVAAK